MYDPNASLTDRTKQDEFIKTKIYEAFNLFVNDKKGFVDKRYNKLKNKIEKSRILWDI